MSLSYEQLTEILLEAGPKFTIEKKRSDGSHEVYRGHDVTAFIQRGDGRHHEHKVFDSAGQLVYHRDVNGKLYIGNAEQWRAHVRRKKVGQAALTGVGIFRDSLRRALRHWGMGR
jgi:hypothetical protein